MKIYVLFGQREERYEGQYAPEAMEIMDEFGYDENPQYLHRKLEMKKKQSDIVNAKIFEIDLGKGSLDRIRSSLYEDIEKMTGEVKYEKTRKEEKAS